jgi:hypothetical protein
MIADITRTERVMLTAIWNAKDKVIDHACLTRVAGVTPRGSQRIRRAMIARNLMAPLTGGQYTITFGGMRALGVTERKA